jgi:methionyl-tRNA formyltransferase
MKVLAVVGSQPRHLYLIKALLHSNVSVRAVVMQREPLTPSVPSGISKEDAVNFVRHFRERSELELSEFGGSEVRGLLHDVDHILVNDWELNSAKVCDFVSREHDDMGVVFGSDMIRDPLLSQLPIDTINMHLGLSPRYRGSATLFWPFYFLEPQYCGATFHKLLLEPDAGDVLHQVCTELKSGDGIHDVGIRTVSQATSDLLHLVNSFRRGWTYQKQKSTGRNFLTLDFLPQHLRVIYNLYSNNIVDEFLAGNLGKSSPNIVKARNIGVD